MLDSAEVRALPARPCAYIAVRVRREDIRTVMGQGLQELHAELRSQGVAPAGPWFTHHPKREPEFFGFEMSVPVGSPVTPRGRVYMGEWPAMRAALAVYRGPYEGLGAAWGEFKAWMAARGLVQGLGGPWECCRAGPESGPDASRYETERVVPVLP